MKFTPAVSCYWGGDKKYVIPEKVVASSVESDFFMACNLLDGSYVTRWEASDADKNPTLLFTFEESVSIDVMEMRYLLFNQLKL